MIAIIGFILLTAGLLAGAAAAAPLRMRIETRAWLMSLVAVGIGVGLMASAEALAPSSASAGDLCYVAIVGAIAALVRLAFAARLRRNRREWETRWQHVVKDPRLRGLFMIYHDIGVG